MNLLGQVPLGIAILLLLGSLVAVKRFATGSVLDRPTGDLLPQVVNIFNLFFLLVVNPLAGILLLTGRLEAFDPSHLAVREPRVALVVELTGLMLYMGGFLLMGWALMTLGRNYQLGGKAPRAGDVMIADGPYRLIRHPMYSAALSISLGLSMLTGSWICLCVFCVYLVLILLLIPMEEDRTAKAYGEQYLAYQRKTPVLVPFIRV